jgi:hypothetical protein
MGGLRAPDGNQDALMWGGSEIRMETMRGA